MRKAKKQMAEEFIRTMFEAQDEMRRYVKNAEVPQAMELLQQCQEGAVTLGNLIESQEGKDFITIPLLEDYCELVYQTYARLEQGKLLNIDKAYKQLKKQLIQIDNSVKYDIQTYREVVFLPYKAAMWDSLESVWKAAEEDDSCHAYVIPIPYYDKKTDGRLGAMHYEGNEYPSYVPITSYETYNFEERQPDMIFIHNPYDECNRVTTVHPFFYSKKMKQYTKELVYIPYFVLEEIDPENNVRIEEMKQYCTTPGVLHANRVVVQSESMRRIYIDVLKKAGGETTEALWKSKILGLGSPKIDKVINTKKEELEIPNDWLKIIKKADNSWKKIVLYNTSIRPLLEHSEKMLEKMKDVFQAFKQRQDEIAFMWRPHPLIQATIQSMRPQLWQEYEQLMQDYQEEGWGIYDDTADVDRAVILSDIYYGDPSSVIVLYWKTKKPILTQDVNVMETDGDSESTVSFHSCGMWKDNLYFFSDTDGIFGKINTNDGKTAFLEEPIYYPFSLQRIIGESDSKDKFFYALKSNEQELIVIDLEKMEMMTIELDQKSGEEKKYIGIAGYENIVYLFSQSMDRFVRINVFTREKKEYSLFRQASGALKKGAVIQHIRCFPDKVLLLTSDPSVLVIFDKRTEQVVCSPLGEQIENIADIFYFHSKIWILDKQGNIKILNEQMEPVGTISLELEDGQRHLVVTEKKVVLLSPAGGDVLLLDRETENLTVYGDYPEELNSIGAKGQAEYRSGCEDQQYYYYLVGKTRYILKIDKLNGNLSWVQLQLPTAQERYEYYLQHQEFSFLEKNIPVKTLLENVKKEERTQLPKSRIGETIWKVLNQE